MNRTSSLRTTRRRYLSPDVPLSAIRRYARRVVEHFEPEQIILFGSYARGTPREGSDVDLLVVIPTSNEISKAARICYELEAPFDLDLIVRTPKRLQRGLRDADWFLREVMETGKVLYAKRGSPVGPKGRSRLGHDPKNPTRHTRTQ